MAAELTEFSKILIFKDTPEIRGLFGSPNGNPNMVNELGPKFYGSFPQETLLTEPVWQPYLERNLLHAMGVEESDYNYNLTPVSSGTAVISGNTLYIGGTSQKNYTGITTGGTEVTVTGSGFTGITTGSKIRLASVTGITGLSIATTYYAYAVTGTTLKLASSFANAGSGTAITSATGSFSGSSTLTVADSDHTYTQYTSFTSPATSLVAGDYIFWGEDPNNLKIGGKIKTVYTSGGLYDAGARYEFEQLTGEAFPTSSGEIVPQEIFYYRKNWNGKGLTTDITTGFYVLIGVELNSNGQRALIPWLEPRGSGGTSADRIVDVATSQKYAYTDLIRLKRISKKYASDITGFQNEPGGISEEIIPCTITRTNSFWSEAAVNGSPLTSFFTAVNQMPPFIAYHVNPYGSFSPKLDKNTTYVIEINERLPALNHVHTVKDTVFFNFANRGDI